MLIKRRVFIVFVCLIVAFLHTDSYGEGYAGVKATQIKKTTQTSNGQGISYLKTSQPEVTVLVVEIPPGGETGWHFHPVPVYAYVLSGSVIVETEDGEKQAFVEGDAIIENVNTPHNGRNTGSVPVRLVVFYTGEDGSPTTVKVDRK
ncbi:MAG: cupin domain-containing protein [Nitrospirota bacterium]